MFFLLSKSRRHNVRAIAREAYLISGYPAGDLQLAKQLAKEKIKREYAGSFWTSILIAIAVRLAWALIQRWWENRSRAPALTYQPNEPGYTGD